MSDSSGTEVLSASSRVSSASKKVLSRSKFTYGHCVNAFGTLYKGTFKNGLKHGQGKLIYADGDKLKWAFANGKANGLCKKKLVQMVKSLKVHM